MVLDRFHPAVSAWFLSAHTCPTEPQARGWSAIQARRHTLIAAPTGSGKTLAAFLSAIDDLVRQAEGPGLPAKTQVLYISPLKALGNDIQKNLSEPLAGISAEMIRLGRPAPDIRVAVRSGDTPQMERAAMLRRAPHILVTTPESCYLLLTSPRGRNLLRSVRTVIVDEIHALVGNKRGSHLALSLERLDALCDSPPVRIGLSATQRPIEEVARFLVGRGPGWNPEREPLLALAEAASGVAPSEAPFPPPVPPEPEAQPCQIVDSGHVRTRDLGLELPASPLEPVMSGEVWTEVYDRLAALVREHRTTLVFVNTRRLAERVARHLSERLGPEAVTAHHGSMAKEHRLEAEQRLKSGKLRALVATASLELGIDVGAVELVCQIGATRSIAAFLQRVGRSGHSLGALPKGRLFPLSRDELVECTALLDAVRREELDHILMPQAPLDVLAQQIVAAASVEEWDQETLYRCVTRAWPYRTLSRREFDAVVTMLARGFTTRRGRAAAYLHHDAVNGRVRARPTARAAALMNGGAIPDNALFDVVQEPTETFIGTVGEDFAIESLPGDVFQLGNASWRILRVDLGKLRVEDAQGQPPTLPFWEGDAPGRTDELSLAVSRLREEVAERLGTPGSAPAPEVLPSGAISFVTPESPVVRWLMAEKGLDGPAALQLAEYLASIRAALGVMPTQRTLVTERFFDEGGGMQMVIHSPFGSRLNRAWGLALRKRFCRQFNFELQAAATEDAIVLSLGPSHSFPLEEVYRYLRSATAREVLVQALLDAPMFPLRWRHNANRALAVLRRQYGRKIPPQWQRMRANDLLALVFPDQQACLENIVGDREVPDHPLVNQTLRDCLEEVMDIDGLERLLRAMESGALELVARDLREPSPLAAEILNAKPYAFLDDAPLEERRTRAVSTRRWLDPETASTLGALDAQAIALVRAEAWPGLEGRAPTPDDLHDALMQLGLVSAMEMAHLTGASSGNLGDALSESPLVASLLAGGRLTRLHLHPSEPSGIPPAPGDGVPRPLPYWAAAEWLPVLRQSHPGAVEHPVLLLPPTLRNQAYTPDEARRELVRARLEVAGPVRLESLAALVALPPPEVTQALAELESEGAVFRGRYTPGVTEEEWCDRGLLARIHRYTLDR
ncbi:MAG: DEAD/DEAH box helicase, partial [Deltaproteobacteria bacterium]|nr:DEAD/DEAH box helicase [Deltaproteobacteria bacterium]